MKKEKLMFWVMLGGLTFMFTVLIFVSTLVPWWGRRLEAQIVREVDELVKRQG